MDLILALDTSTDICSVALGTAFDFVEDTRKIPRQHNKYVLSIIDRLFEVSEQRKADLACIAFSAGPGSFTGIRMSAAVAQGIGFALGTRIYRAQSALVLAQSVKRTLRLDEAISVSRHSRQDLYYTARLTTMGSECTFIRDEELARASPSPVANVGRHFRSDIWNVSAREVLLLADANRDDWQSPELAVPFYIEGDSPWQTSI